MIDIRRISAAALAELKRRAGPDRQNAEGVESCARGQAIRDHGHASARPGRARHRHRPPLFHFHRALPRTQKSSPAHARRIRAGERSERTAAIFGAAEVRARKGDFRTTWCAPMAPQRSPAPARRPTSCAPRSSSTSTRERRRNGARSSARKRTPSTVAEDFIKDKLPGERKGREAERDIRREFIPAWGKRPIAEITAQDVREVVKAAKDRGAPYQAHNLLVLARRLFSWAIDQQVYGLETSPCERLKPKAIIGKKVFRTRILDDDELRAFWRATQRLGYPYGPLFRMLALPASARARLPRRGGRKSTLRKSCGQFPPSA